MPLFSHPSTTTNAPTTHGPRCAAMCCALQAPAPRRALVTRDGGGSGAVLLPELPGQLLPARFLRGPGLHPPGVCVAVLLVLSLLSTGPTFASRMSRWPWPASPRCVHSMCKHARVRVLHYSCNCLNCLASSMCRRSWRASPRCRGRAQRSGGRLWGMNGGTLRQRGELRHLMASKAGGSCWQLA